GRQWRSHYRELVVCEQGRVAHDVVVGIYHLGVAGNRLRWGELPVDREGAGGHSAQPDPGDAEVRTAARGADVQSPQGDCSPTHGRGDAAEYAGVRPVAPLVLQHGVES